jgi:hypothetical protein
VLPISIRAQGKDEGQRLAVGEKIRLLAYRAQQVQRHHGAGGDEARQQPLRLLQRGRPGGGVRASCAGFDKGWRGRRQLGAPGQVKTQGMLSQPALRLVEGEDGALVLAPVRRPCCLELLCCQRVPFSRGGSVFTLTGRDAFKHYQSWCKWEPPLSTQPFHQRTAAHSRYDHITVTPIML